MSDPTKGANNWPLRGGKAGNFEGGIRVNALASGGVIPSDIRGTQVDTLMHVADLWATLCSAVGISPEDSAAAASHLPGVDSISFWSTVLNPQKLSDGINNGTRTELPLSDGDTVQGIISLSVAPGAMYKLLLGKVNSDFRGSSVSPTASSPNATKFDCGQSIGCLFELISDPYETKDLADVHPDVAAALKTRVAFYQSTLYNPDRGSDDHRCCEYARNVWGGFLGPFDSVPKAVAV